MDNKLLVIFLLINTTIIAYWVGKFIGFKEAFEKLKGEDD